MLTYIFICDLFELSYEGTGRSLSYKLLQQLEEQGNRPAKNVENTISGTFIFLVLFVLAFSMDSPRICQECSKGTWGTGLFVRE